MKQKQIWIGRSHLLPGMNKEKLETLYSKYNILKDWDNVPEITIDRMIADIQAHLDKSNTAVLE